VQYSDSAITGRVETKWFHDVKVTALFPDSTGGTVRTITVPAANREFTISKQILKRHNKKESLVHEGCVF
jgi:hypothetical protein